MRTAGYFLGAVLAAALGACAHHIAQGPSGQTALAAGPPPAASCPLERLPGVHATVADIRDGVAITFTGSEGELDQLRNNVHAMADANDNQKDAFAACPCARTAGAGAAERMPSTAPERTSSTAATGEMAQPQASAKVDEIATGAVLKLTAKDHKETAALRSAVREEVRALRKNCLARTPEPASSTAPRGTRP